MPYAVGVRFKSPGKVYFFDPCEFELTVKQRVIVETVRGLELGQVAAPPGEYPQDEAPPPYRPVVRMATEEDLKQHWVQQQRASLALTVCKQKVREHNLAMDLAEAEYTFDASRLTIYFTADDRVDFRQLARELAGIFRTRVDLRQIGVRDAAGLVGGIGSCGRVLCCAQHLTEFKPVTLAMAKNQGLPLNTSKLTGKCGKLKCCLRYEDENYKHGKLLEGDDTGCGACPSALPDSEVASTRA